MAVDLPCDEAGCMACGNDAPTEVELLRCSTCTTSWHSPCLSNPPALSDAATWSCPDCSGAPAALAAPAAGDDGDGELVAGVRATEASVDLPCNESGCLACGVAAPTEVELLRCSTCTTSWHSPCLSNPPALSDAATWSCPDCSGNPAVRMAPAAGGDGELVAGIRAIEADTTLSEEEKARRRQNLLAGRSAASSPDDDDDSAKDDVLNILGESFSCPICMNLLDRPVTTPCGHNFCLKCFNRWTKDGNRVCGKCRKLIPTKMVQQPRINSKIAEAIRTARMSKTINSTGSVNWHHYIQNADKPDSAYTTERAKRAGKANASSGKIFVTTALDHFGPILPEHDPEKKTGVRVGKTWGDRFECRQWGAHLPHIAGIAGQSRFGAQSVALSGGYEDDEDHGDWFLYTGSGGRDLRGNKRTNKEQSSDQQFVKLNEALRQSCLRGYPVRVVRSHKDKHSSYAPETGLRYDGIYRIEKCWRKVGIQGTFKVCRYLFVRCDNEPAPWTSDELGDRPRPLPDISELKDATDINERGVDEHPSWDYDENEGCWKWMSEPPKSRKPWVSKTGKQVREGRIARSDKKSDTERLLNGLSCSICCKVMNEPLTTPCGHNFCKTCLLGAYENQSSFRERSSGGRTLRAQKIVKRCPSCQTDISDFVADPQINRDIANVIESLQRNVEEGNTKEVPYGGGDMAEELHDGDQEESDGGDLEMDKAEEFPDDGDQEENDGGSMEMDEAARSFDVEDGDNVEDHKDNPAADTDANASMVRTPCSPPPAPTMSALTAPAKTAPRTKRVSDLGSSFCNLNPASLSDEKLEVVLTKKGQVGRPNAKRPKQSKAEGSNKKMHDNI